MAARQSEEVRQAIRLHGGGKSVYQAAAMAGIAPSTLYRALKIKENKKVDMAVALCDNKPYTL